MVGESTKQELIDAWGEPIESVDTAEGSVLAYDIDPFQSVEVLVGRDEVVEAIKVALAAPLEPKHLAEQLSLDDFRPVTAMDDADQPLGQAFPERGVLFMFQSSDADASNGDGRGDAGGVARRASAGRSAGLCHAGRERLQRRLHAKKSPT